MLLPSSLELLDKDASLAQSLYQYIVALLHHVLRQQFLLLLPYEMILYSLEFYWPPYSKLTLKHF